MTYELDRWAAVACGSGKGEKNPLKVPYEEALREAVRAALFLKNRWKPRGKAPGLSSLPQLSLSLSQDLLSLVHAIQEAQLRLFLEEEAPKADPPEKDPIEEARGLISELGAALEFLRSGGLGEPFASRVSRARALPQSQDLASVQLSLMVHLEVALALRAELSALKEGFEQGTIEEARRVLGVLEQRPEEEASAASVPHSRRIFYQLLSLMTERVGQIRAGAKFLYRKYPRLLRAVTSTYDRNRRVRAGVKKKQKDF